MSAPTNKRSFSVNGIWAAHWANKLLGKQVTGQAALILAAPPSQTMQRLGAGRSKRPNLEVGVLTNQPAVPRDKV